MAAGPAGFGVEDPFGAGVNSPEYAEIPPAQDPDRDLKDFSAYVFDNAQRSWEETFERSGESYQPREARPLQRRRLDGLRERVVRRRPVLLPG